MFVVRCGTSQYEQEFWVGEWRSLILRGYSSAVAV